MKLKTWILMAVIGAVLFLGIKKVDEIRHPVISNVEVESQVDEELWFDPPHKLILELEPHINRYVIRIEVNKEDSKPMWVGMLEKDGKFDVEYSSVDDFTDCAKMFFDEVVRYANTYYEMRKEE